MGFKAIFEVLCGCDICSFHPLRPLANLGITGVWCDVPEGMLDEIRRQNTQQLESARLHPLWDFHHPFLWDRSREQGKVDQRQECLMSFQNHCGTKQNRRQGVMTPLLCWWKKKGKKEDKALRGGKPWSNDSVPWLAHWHYWADNQLAIYKLYVVIWKGVACFSRASLSWIQRPLRIVPYQHQF